MANQGPVDCSSRHLYRQASCSNQGDTNRCTIPRHCQPCRKVRNHSAKTISPAQCLHNRLHQHLSPEIFPATCWPSIFHWAETHRPTRRFFPITRRAQQIQTPLQLANVWLPISQTLPRQDKRSAAPDNSPCL